MAEQKAQEPDKIALVKTQAAAAVSVPALKAEVVRLAEEVEQLKRDISSLSKRLSG